MQMTNIWGAQQAFQSRPLLPSLSQHVHHILPTQLHLSDSVLRGHTLRYAYPTLKPTLEGEGRAPLSPPPSA